MLASSTNTIWTSLKSEPAVAAVTVISCVPSPKAAVALAAVLNAADDGGEFGLRRGGADHDFDVDLASRTKVGLIDIDVAKRADDAAC